MNNKINIITDLDGSKIVLINDIRFKSRRGIVWNNVEDVLKEYIGNYYEIVETSEKVYIGSDFPDERYNIFCTRMLVRCDKDGRLYLYDIVRTKKKRANRLNNTVVR